MHADGMPEGARLGAMTAISFGIVLAVMDGAIANVALPTLARAFRSGAGETVWVVNAYQLTIVALLLPLASLGERITYRRVYLPGLALFVAASVGCALAGSLAALVAARVVQGVGAAAIMAVNGALVRTIVPHVRLGRAVGVVALMVAASAAAGPTVAALILSVAPWPFLFLVNVPTGLLALLVGVRALPSSARSERPFDVPSAGLGALAFTFVFVGVEWLARGTGSRVAAGGVLLGAGAAAFALLLRRERGQARPLFPVDLLRIPLFAGSVATSVASFAAQGLAFVALPFLFERGFGRDAVATGLLITPWPIATACAAPLAGRLSDRLPAAVLGGLGLATLAAGLLLLATAGGTPSDGAISWRMAVCGAGFGLFQSPNNRTLLGSAPRTRAGAASGMLATARLAGQTAGASAAAILFRTAEGAGPHLALLAASGVAAVASALSLVRLRLGTEEGARHTGTRHTGGS